MRNKRSPHSFAVILSDFKSPWLRIDHGSSSPRPIVCTFPFVQLSHKQNCQLTERQPMKKWVQKVTTDSVHTPKDIFTKPAKTIARTLAKPEISPKGIGSAIRM